MWTKWNSLDNSNIHHLKSYMKISKCLWALKRSLGNMKNIARRKKEKISIENSSLSIVSRSTEKNWPIRTMKGPWRVLSVQGSLHILHFLWHHPNENSYWLYFCILCNKNGIKGLWGHKGQPSLGVGPALVLQCTTHGPTIHPTLPFIYCLYFCILCNKNCSKGLWKHTGWPP